MEKTVISKDGRFEWDEEKNEINQQSRLKKRRSISPSARIKNVQLLNSLVPN